MTALALVFLAAASAIIMTVAAWLMLRVSDTDAMFAARVGVAQGRRIKPIRGEAPHRRALLETIKSGLSHVGWALLRSGLVPGRTRVELRQALKSSGFRGSNAVALFLGTKLVLIMLFPLAGLGIANALGLQYSTRLVFMGGGFIAGLLAPDTVVRRIRSGYLARLEDGLPDALDLMVICAQAGLSLEPAMSRVAAEMRLSRIEVSTELEQTVRELEMMADAQVALGNLAQRTGLPTLKRLVSTLVQTMQYGTPLTEALRNLSAEVRQQALTRFEARAARLSVLLTLPMILFILPCVFIVVGGPAVIQIMKAFGH